MFYYCTLCPYLFITYLLRILHLSILDSNDHVYANVTLVMNTHDAKHCKDVLQERSMILMSFCPKFIGVYMCQ